MTTPTNIAAQTAPVLVQYMHVISGILLENLGREQWYVTVLLPYRFFCLRVYLIIISSTVCLSF